MARVQADIADDPRAHDLAADDINSVIGDLVYRPPAGTPCEAMPKTSLTRADIRAAGKRVLIVGNCQSRFARWGSWVHERQPNWEESSSGEGDDYPDYPACLAERASKKYGENWIRYWEDSTGLSTADGVGSTVSAIETRRMVRCGVNMPGFDRLHADDPRLPQLVWSWAPNEPIAGGGEARGPDARFRARSCGDVLPLACVAPDGGWTIADTCPTGTQFSVPANGFENERLREAKAAAGVGTVWLADRNVGGSWVRL